MKNYELDNQKIIFETVLSNIGDGVIILDNSKNIIYINTAVKRIIESEGNDLTGISYEQLIRLIGEKFYESIESSDKEYNYRKEKHNKGLNVQVKVIIDSKGKEIGQAVILPNILECDISHQLIHRMAHYDSLTGLANRSLLTESLDKTIKGAEAANSKVAVAFIDLDNFKLINDTMGHDSGDQLLKKVSGIIQSCLGDNDTAGRIGGDEFVIIMPYSRSYNEPLHKVRKLVEMLDKPIRIKEMEFYVTASIGISVYPAHGMDGKTLVKNADTAMYDAKAAGRNTYRLYSYHMNLKAKEELELVNDLKRAIDNNEFVLHYQPQVDIRTNEVLGVEALIRWVHPSKGIISPDKFIPVAEETGFIIPIGEWVLREACRQNKEWQERGNRPIRVAVNLSIKQFEHSNLVDTVKDVLKETGLDAEWLELEITESVAVSCFECAVKKLEQLKEIGVYISLDDFGTGYSSFNYLRQLPLDTLKIDRAFLENISADSNEEYIAKTMISLAKKLKLKVVAEGVETLGQLRFLQKENCSTAQGYLFSRPVPAAEIEGTIMQWRERAIN